MIGRRYMQRIGECLTGCDPSSAQIGMPQGLVLKAGASDRSITGVAEMMGGLWFRLSVGMQFLEAEGWFKDDMIEVSLGIERGFPNPTRHAPSVAHAIADLALVAAMVKSRESRTLARDHRSYIRATTGTIGEPCWEYGQLTERGRGVDATYKYKFLGAVDLRVG